MKTTKTQRGFTLLELMIVVVVIAILAAIAYPSYSAYAFRARRAEGKNLLMAIAAAEERFFTNNNRYTNDITTAPPTGLGLTTTSENGAYTVAVSGLGANNITYTLTATPQLVQANDRCGALSLSNTGVKLPDRSNAALNSNGYCW